MIKWPLRFLIAALIACVVIALGTLKLGWFSGTEFSDRLRSIVSGSTGPEPRPAKTPEDVTEKEQQEFNKGISEIIDQSGGSN